MNPGSTYDEYPIGLVTHCAPTFSQNEHTGFLLSQRVRLDLQVSQALMARRRGYAAEPRGAGRLREEDVGEGAEPPRFGSTGGDVAGAGGAAPGNNSGCWTTGPILLSPCVLACWALKFGLSAPDSRR